MYPLPPPLAFFCLLFSGWINRQQQAVIDYLLEENRVLRAAHGSRRVRLTDDQRRRLAVKGKALGRHRHPGHDPAVVSAARGPEIRRLEGATPWSSKHQAGYRRARRADGNRKPDV